MTDKLNYLANNREIADVINNVLDGKINAIGAFTCSINQGSTTITDLRVGVDSVILTMATTANASLDNLYITTTKQQFTVNHNNNSQADRTFKYVVIG